MFESNGDPHNVGVTIWSDGLLRFATFAHTGRVAWTDNKKTREYIAGHPDDFPVVELMPLGREPENATYYKPAASWMNR